MKFDAWFRAQFGHKPMTIRRREELGRTIQSLKQRLALNQVAAVNDDILSHQYDAALYAWNARHTKANREAK